MARPRGNLRDKVDRQALHEFLWEKRGRNDVIPYSQKELAENLGVNLWTINKIFAEMREGGRIRRVGSKFQVIDPEIHAWNHTPERLF